MAISLYSGTPGSYKSYHATADIVQWLGWGKNVISNYPVDASKYYKKRKKLGVFKFVTNEQLTVDYLIKFACQNHKPGHRKAQTLIVIDEASIKFNAREIDRKDRMEWIKFLANHRHYGFNIILIAQNDRMIDRQIRGLLEYDIKHRALRNWNLSFAIASILSGGLYHCVEYWYPTHIKTSTNLHRFNKKIANCYDTMALFNLDDTKSNEIKSVPTSASSSSSATTIDREKLRARLQQVKRGANSA